MTAPTPIEDLWTVTDVERFLSVGRTWIYAACARGELPHIRLGAQLIRFDREAVKKWAAAKAQAKPAPVLALTGGRR